MTARSRCRAAFKGLQAATAILILATLSSCGIPYGAGPPDTDGTQTTFTADTANGVGADFAKCPHPVDVRTRSKSGYPDWEVWIDFPATNSTVASLLRSCLNIDAQYSPQLWSAFSSPWESPSGFTTSDLGPKGGDVEAISVRDSPHPNTSRQTNIFRAKSDRKIFRIDVWFTDIDP